VTAPRLEPSTGRPGDPAAADARCRRRGAVSALSGVTLSASLLPPVVNAGLMFAFSVVFPELKTCIPNGEYDCHEDSRGKGSRLVDVASVSLALYGVNVASIVAFAFVTFKLKRISGLTLRSLGAALDEGSDDDEYGLDPGSPRSSSRRLLLPRWQSQTTLRLSRFTSDDGGVSPSTKSEPCRRGPGAESGSLCDEPRLDAPLLPSEHEHEVNQSAPANALVASSSASGGPQTPPRVGFES